MIKRYVLCERGKIKLCNPFKRGVIKPCLTLENGMTKRKTYILRDFGENETSEIGFLLKNKPFYYLFL